MKFIAYTGEPPILQPARRGGSFLGAMEWMQHLQWPAMAATLFSAWLVAEQSKNRRQWGFWFFLLSNVLWIAWGWHDHAYALIILQIGLAFLNMRGAAKND